MQCLKNGRHNVHQGSVFANDPGRGTRHLDHQGHTQRRIVNEESVFLFAVVTQAFAVITRQDDQRVRKALLLLQKRHQTTHLSIHKSDFPIIGASLVAADIGLRRLVRVVGIVQVNPKEERSLRFVLHPRQCFVYNGITWSFHDVCLLFVKVLEIEVVEVGLKALIQSIAGIQNGRTEESRCGVAVLAEDRGQRNSGGRKRIGGKVVHARGHGEATRKKRSMCGKRKRDRSKGVPEPRGGARQGIDVGRLNQPVAVAPQVVGADRVNSNDDDIGFFFRCLEFDSKRDEKQDGVHPPHNSAGDEKAFRECVATSLSPLRGLFVSHLSPRSCALGHCT